MYVDDLNVGGFIGWDNVLKYAREYMGRKIERVV